MANLFLRNIFLNYGTTTLLNHVDLQIEPGERLCIVGRNGEGKSTLLKIMEGSITPDGGTRVVPSGIRLAKLQQEVPHDMEGTVFHIIAAGLGNIGELIEQFHTISHEVATNYTEELMDKMAKIQHQIDEQDGWEVNQKVETIISKLSLPSDDEFSSLSGGMKRRVLLAQALIQKPDILLLDEPTNHLDIPSIQWLEDFLKNLNCSLVFITHDRSFLQALATRIVEVDRGKLHNWECDYDTYLIRKEEQLNSEAKTNAVFDKKLAQEEVWIRQGVKARRTRNEGRVRDLEKLRSEHQARRSQQGNANLQVNRASSSGKQVFEIDNISFGWPGKQVIKDFTCMISRGDKIGIIGENGCGKSTLINLLLGKIKPDQGEIIPGTKIEIAYFDQHREQLDDEKPVVESVLEESDHVEINGHRKHIMSYLSDFLFSPERARQPVKALSGGERNRLLLARIFCKPSNLLILDEPTNDLDIETLELLEELVLNYQGTVLIVSHDRAFLNNVATSSIVFDAPGVVNEYVGGYDDWLRQRPASFTSLEKPVAKNKAENTPTATQAVKPQKLSYKEKTEFDELPEKIDVLESQISAFNTTMYEADFYQRDDRQSIIEQHQHAESALNTCFERWEMLESKIEGS